MINKNTIQIVILAAGKGTRMKTDEPKALTPLLQKPFLKHILETIEKLDLALAPVIVVGHKKERIFETIGEHYIYAFQEQQLGTGHALKSAKDKISPLAEMIFVISTDQPTISTNTIESVMEIYEKEKPKVAIATVKLPDFLDWRSGIIRLGRIVRDENGNVLKNIEYKDASEKEREITEINPAIYAFEKNWLWANIEKIKNENASGEYYLTDLIGLAREQNEKVVAVPVHNILEGLQPNSLEELEVLENLLKV